MRKKGDKVSRIPKFSSDEEAFEWYESHEMTDHLEDTEEISPDSVFYQDSKGVWYRSSDGMTVPARLARNNGYWGRGMANQGRFIHEVALRQVPVFQNTPEADESNIVIIGGEDTWSLTLLSSVITLNP